MLASVTTPRASYQSGGYNFFSGGGGDRVIGHGDNDGGDGNGNEPGQPTLTTLAQLQPSSPVWQRTTVCSKVEFF